MQRDKRNLQTHACKFTKNPQTAKRFNIHRAVRSLFGGIDVSFLFRQKRNTQKCTHYACAGLSRKDAMEEGTRNVERWGLNEERWELREESWERASCSEVLRFWSSDERGTLNDERWELNDESLELNDESWEMSGHAEWIFTWLVRTASLFLLFVRFAWLVFKKIYRVISRWLICFISKILLINKGNNIGVAPRT